MTYMYRADGKRTALTFTYGGVSYPYAWTYSNAGRRTARAIPIAGHRCRTIRRSRRLPRRTPKQWSYDANGDLQALSLPVIGHYTQMTHDLEGALSAYTVVPVAPQSPGATYQMAIGTNIVGETSP